MKQYTVYLRNNNDDTPFFFAGGTQFSSKGENLPFMKSLSYLFYSLISMIIRYAPKKSVRTFSVPTGTSSVLMSVLPRVLLLVLTVQYD